MSFHVAYVYWLLSGVAVATLVAWLWSLGTWRRLAAVAVNAATSFANLLLTASLYVQGTGFNAQFFYHLDGETFAIARHAYSLVFFGAWTFWLVLCVGPFLLGWRRQPWLTGRLRGRMPPLAAVAGVVAYAPLLSVVAFALSGTDELTATMVPKTGTAAIEPEPVRDPKNLVLIFAESLEATYSRADIFGADFTPRLTALASLGANFDDMREVDNTGSTITGMVGAMCALPLRSPMPWQQVNTVLPNVDVVLPGEACLADVLSAHGYRTVFMGGAPLAFAGKGKFLAAHGFQERYGADDFLPLLKDPDYRSGWGIHDDTLLDFAQRKLDELSGRDTPFALALLTLDTHHPAGLPSGSCPERGREGTDMEFAIRCSDKLLSRFIDDVRTRYDNIVVALFSDHLAHRNQLFAQLKSQANSRRLRFSVWGEGVEPVRIERRGTHYDVMPTILDYLGFKRWLNHNFGASLRRFDSPWFVLYGESRTPITQNLPNIYLDNESRLVFSARGPTIDIEEHRVLATNEGLSLQNSIFAMEFDKKGNIVGFHNSESDVDFFTKTHNELWVGVSMNEVFNRKLIPDENAKIVFFVGCFDTEVFVAESLWWRKSVDVEKILDGCAIDTP